MEEAKADYERERQNAIDNLPEGALKLKLAEVKANFDEKVDMINKEFKETFGEEESQLMSQLEKKFH